MANFNSQGSRQTICGASGDSVMKDYGVTCTVGHLRWFYMIGRCSKTNSTSDIVSCKRWHKPPSLFLTDTAIFSDLNSVGIASVLHDEAGGFMACRIQLLIGIPSVRECVLDILCPT